MTQITLSTDQLKKSVSNVRAGHTKEDIKTMANSIKHRGLIHAPAVALNGDGKYEIVAGQLRVAGAIAAGLTEIECHDVTELDDAARVELSLSENVDRRRMTVLETYSAFHKLFKAGTPVPEIGVRFEKTEREVQQILAIGSLPKKILALGEAGEIGDRTLKALAIASGKDVVRYGKLTAKTRPKDWEINSWLAGDAGMYKAKHALFDLDLYVGPSIVDLFDEEDEVWLTDGDQFWTLQDTAMNQILEDYDNKKWKTQQIDHFASWEWDKTKKADGGKVLYTVNKKSGEVKFHVGYDKKKGTGKAPTTKKNGKPEAKPETSKAFEQYIAQIRHDAVCKQMVDFPKTGLVAVIMLLVKRCDNIDMRAPINPIKSDAYIESLNGSDNFIDVRMAFDDAMTDMGLKKDEYVWDIDLDKLGNTLLQYDTNSLLQFLCSIMARNWSIVGEGKDSDAIGRVLGLKTVNAWVADDAFWDGIKNKATLIKIAKDNKIAVVESDKAAKIRATLKAQMPDEWRPDWLSF